MPSRADRKGQRLDEKLTGRNFEDEDVRSALDEMDVDQLISTIGKPVRSTQYAHADGWSEGDGRPSLADDDPAVMQAIGRCAANRLRGRLPGDLFGGVHFGECGWCSYPLEQLLTACAWAVAMSGYVTADLLIWRNAVGATYLRALPAGDYRNRRWREFFALAPAERERRTVVASGRVAA